MTDTTLLQDFITETEEHIEEMEAGLLRLEADPTNRDLLNEIFRSAHTIKGSAEYLGMNKIGGSHTGWRACWRSCGAKSLPPRRRSAMCSCRLETESVA